MAAKTSAGLLMYRIRGGTLETLLVHPGGPFWKKKDEGAWFVPKGEVEHGEDELAAARREFREETGIEAGGEFIPLGTVRHKRGKVVRAWGFSGDCDPATVRSNTFELEWPPRSGRRQRFPEIDRADFFTVEHARSKIHPAEVGFVERLHVVCRERGLLASEEGTRRTPSVRNRRAHSSDDC